MSSSHVTAPQDRIPVAEKFAFGARAFAQQLGTNGMKMFAFPAYGIILGLDPALIGIVFALTRIYDGVTDPLVGWLSDNTRTKWGRRRPWIFVGAVLGGITFMLLWMAQPDWSDTMKAVYFVAFTLLFYTAFTMMTVPTDALGWELSPDYAERTRLMTWFSATVKITLFVLPWMFALTQLEYWENEAQGLMAIGVLFGVLFIATGILPALLCKERFRRIATKEGKLGFIESLKFTFSNKVYLLVCGITLSSIFAGQVYMLFGTYLGVYYLFDNDKVAGGNFFGMFASLGALVGLLTVLLISRFFAEVDKRILLLIGKGVALVGWVGAIFLITPVNPWLTFIPVCLNAVGIGVTGIVMGSIYADVADADELANGYRREGSLAAFVSFLAKVAGTIGALLGGFALSVTGFNAELPAQSELTLSTMKWIYVGFPIVGYGVSLILAYYYPYTKEKMFAIRAELEARRGKVNETKSTNKADTTEAKEARA